jgi:hypothetical protein
MLQPFSYELVHLLVRKQSFNSLYCNTGKEELLTENSGKQKTAAEQKLISQNCLIVFSYTLHSIA